MLIIVITNNSYYYGIVQYGLFEISEIVEPPDGKSGSPHLLYIRWNRTYLFRCNFVILLTNQQRERKTRLALSVSISRKQQRKRRYEIRFHDSEVDNGYSQRFNDNGNSIFRLSGGWVLHFPMQKNGSGWATRRQASSVASTMVERDTWPFAFTLLSERKLSHCASVYKIALYSITTARSTV